MGQVRLWLVAVRTRQWLKNLSVFAAPLFTGYLFTPSVFWQSIKTFLAFCLLSSASYLLNDVVDASLDRLHPHKKYRPIAAGKIKPFWAIVAFLGLGVGGLVLLAAVNLATFLLGSLFLLLHLGYTFWLKQYALADILAIAASFFLRVLAGETATGLHLPVWLMFSVVFLSLFIAAGKRRSELTHSGETTRPTLAFYDKALLNFYVSIFAVATLLSYALFTYLSKPIFFHNRWFAWVGQNFPILSGRKWLMTTIFPVIVGIMRYAQLVFVSSLGEQPEQALWGDRVLLGVVVSWGLLLIFFLYVV